MLSSYLRQLDSTPWVPKLLSAVLGGLIVVELISGVYHLINFERAQARLFAARSTPARTMPAANSAPVDILPLFGDGLQLDVMDTSIAISPLDATLVGIFYAETQQDCEVILQMPDKQERVFHVGDTLIEGALLKRIERDEVFIVRQGRVERLSLPEKGLHFDPPAKPLGEE